MFGFFSKKLLGIIFIILFLLLCFIFRARILEGIGNFLIHEDKLQSGDAIFVLGGDSYDRGNYALKLYNEGYSERIICMGENVPSVFRALGIAYSESEVTKINIVSTKNIIEPEKKSLINDTTVIVLKKGTSTMEEISAITDYSEENKYKKIIIVSSKFHTRRIGMIINEYNLEGGPEIIISGAPSTNYSEREWWKSEDGLIMVNNEYVKLLYYLIKY